MNTTPMTDREARTFGDSLMLFGKYDGTRIDDVPLDYLLWLDEEPIIAYLGFRELLHRYIRSDRIQREQE